MISAFFGNGWICYILLVSRTSGGGNRRDKHFTQDDNRVPRRRTLSVCEWKDRRAVSLQAVDTHPHGIVTGLRVRKCYAHPTTDCRPPISADHAIAQAIWEEFQRTPVIRVLSDGTTRTIPSAAAGRNVLCRRHNSALSPLDDIGCRFVRALTRQIQHRFENSSEDTHVLFNGFDVERWMLKVLCTIAHGERASRLRPSSTWRVPRSWLRILFEGHPLPPGAGVYVPRVARGRFAGGILTAKIVGHTGRPIEAGARDFNVYQRSRLRPLHVPSVRVREVAVLVSRPYASNAKRGRRCVSCSPWLG